MENKIEYLTYLINRHVKTAFFRQNHIDLLDAFHDSAVRNTNLKTDKILNKLLEDILTEYVPKNKHNYHYKKFITLWKI